MSIDYIIVQAGGRGTRMEPLTRNKPKALVLVNNKPILFHLFDKFPDKKFIIIGDYKFSVLKAYIEAFAEVDFELVCSSVFSGTCAGIEEALSYIPENKSFMLIWSDLILSEDYKLPDDNKNYIGIATDFECRWSYKNNIFSECKSEKNGVAGLFIFNNKSYLADLPENGEFVRWLSGQKVHFDIQSLSNSKEYGTYKSCDVIKAFQCRYFNSIEVSGRKLVKRPLTELGEKLAEREVLWYKKAKETGFKSIPEIYDYEPLSMEYIQGKSVFHFSDAEPEDKLCMLKNIVSELKILHSSEYVVSSCDSYYNAYIKKTFERLEKVRNLIPFATDEFIVINGRKCRNVFFFKSLLEEAIMNYMPESFCFIHGDCTFSNIIIDVSGKPLLIDPRGYFGNTELYGDEAYDWAKLYYSLFTDYDQFNMNKFELYIKEREVEVNILSNNWSFLDEQFFDFIGKEFNKNHILLKVAIIWLSFTTYTWENYDAICAAFYNGLYYLEEVL